MNNTFASLTSIIKEHKSVLIMSHKNIDLDALGSSCALYNVIREFNIDCKVCINSKELRGQVKKAIEMLPNVDFIYKSKINSNDFDLLIILDTAREELLEEPLSFGEIKDVIVIDHHIVSSKNIDASKLSYINSNLSSVNEFMVSYIKYLNTKISSSLATIMLAGIEIDTNFYRVKTSADTFLSAAFLLHMGADPIMKQFLIKEPREIYLNRVRAIENSYIINNYGICVVDGIVEKEELSIIAERLLMFDDVHAAFTIGYTYDKIVSISARSLGEIDVYKIMVKFGGGGHLTEAAAKIKNTDVKSVEKELLKELEVK